MMAEINSTKNTLYLYWFEYTSIII